ncbi:TonB-dependent receptor plug domain-containing protein [Pseudoduganella plicata]|uniref:TonB-dependent receptor n=1 Tax=Pseudoduganella plicata TaxID=321984 RepID=A0A4P7BGK8_9BURK|nr:TonB-dependent receptor [Pseudoduganella plicata]QBQ37383.1 TonB-dependent receptor [Pseudoduganella plicata]GGZ08704.1 TonB-dependent receptor [Pseudoduganella plicata]
MSKLTPFACAAMLVMTTATAQTDPAADKPTADNPTTKAETPPDTRVVPQVTITGGRQTDMDVRRNSTAAKQIYGREELDRNGDTSLGDVLKRLPGVTIGGRPGRGGDVRMRGLGSGYTQILLNGERPPAGFSMESISPDQVERIEVMRGPVAEHSTRAIAGTINVVLREDYVQRDNQLRVADSIEDGRHSPNVSVTIPGKSGAFTYSLSASMMQNRQHDEGRTHNVDTLDDGTITKDQDIADESAGTGKSIHLAPRLSYKFDNGDTINFQPFLMHNVRDSGSSSTLVQTAGIVAPEYNFAEQQSYNDSTFLRGFGNWLHKMDGNAKLDVKFGFGAGKIDSDSLRHQYDTAGNLLDRFTDTDATRDRSINTGGKYTRPIGRGHLLAAGWDLEASHREQTRVSLDKNGNAQFADSGDNLTADTRRVALFAQDEWDVTPQFGMYIGLRWEGIRTTSDRSAGTVKNTSSVFSPLLHGVWRIPGFEKDQVRASLTKSYKSPNVGDLIAAPFLSRLNSATRPDRSGNPDLKPELATGLDIAYEHYIGRSGIVSAGGFIRDIDNLIRRELTLRDTELGPRWLSTPSNIGHARTSGIELEAKFKLTELLPTAPDIDVRTNYSHFWSRVDGIPGPDNRLDQQAKQTANVGLDYRSKAIPLTLGGILNWTPLTRVRTSTEQIVEVGRKRALDVYALWKFDARTQLRIAAANTLADDAPGSNLVYANGLASRADTVNPTFVVWSARLETKF